MAVKRTLNRRCPKCGNRQVTRRGNRIWHSPCPCERVPGPQSAPVDYGLNDVLLDDGTDPQVLRHDVNPQLDEFEDRLCAIRAKLEQIVCTGGCDAGVVLLSQEGTTHTETVGDRQVQVYDHEYFSPLGDALIELYKLAGGTVDASEES